MIKSTCIAFLLIFQLAYTQDKSFERKEVTDTQKKLDIKKGGLTDTKKLLRKTDSLSKSQITLMRQMLVNSIGKEAYVYFSANYPNLVNSRLKYTWLKYQLEMQNNEWKAKEKREAARNKGKLSKTRARDYEKKYAKNNASIETYQNSISKLDAMMVDNSKKSSTTKDFFENEVGEKGARLTNKFGTFQLNLKKGDKVITKSSSLDRRYYEVKHNDKIYFALKTYFLKH